MAPARAAAGALVLISGRAQGIDQVTDLLEIATGHDEAGVLFYQWQQHLQKLNFHQKVEKQIFTQKSVFKSNGLGGVLDGVGLHVFGPVCILDSGFAIGHLPKFVLKNSFRKLS